MVPFMRTFGYDIRKSIGTAAAVGFLIAFSGTITMIIGGKIIDNVNTPFSIGYINLTRLFSFCSSYDDYGSNWVQKQFIK